MAELLHEERTPSDFSLVGLSKDRIERFPSAEGQRRH